LQPTGGAVTPQLGARVALEITDVGRVALGSSMGPEISQVEGRLISTEGGEYLVSVSSVRLLRGGSQVWSGERVGIRTDYVNTMYLRRLSKGRTAVSLAVVGGLTAFLLTRGLLADFFGQQPGDTTTDTADSHRGPRLAPPVRRFNFHGVF